MAKRLILSQAAVLIAALALAPAASAATRKIAVLPLTRGAGGPEVEGLGSALADMMVTDLMAVPELVLVERQRLADVLAELELSETAFVDESSAQEMGRGLGAEMVVVGSFSVLEGQLVIDCRLVAVATGAVLKAARAQGEVADFVSIEKDVVEGLVEGLEVELSRAERRLLLLQAPTEDFEAFASYGRGVKAKQDGELDAARAAFEEALQRDPEFARASEELADLAAMVQTEQAKEKQRSADARMAAVYAALEQIPPETSRPKDFVDTRDSLMDLSLRFYLLSRSGQYCQRYEEMLHLLDRRDGQTEDWWSDLPGGPQGRFELAADLMQARATELGLTGDGALFGRRPNEAMHDAGLELGGGADLLISRNLSPEKFSDSLVYSMECCFPIEARLATWDDVRQRAEGWAVLDKPLYKKNDGSLVTLTSRDAVELYAARLRATHLGVDADVTRLTEAVLARHPEGDDDRSKVLGRIQSVVVAGEEYERRVAGQLGMTHKALEGAALAVRDGDGSLIRLDVPLCAALAQQRVDRVNDELQRYEELAADSSEGRRLAAATGLGSLLAPLAIAGCFTGGEEPLTVAEAYPAVRQALDRRHPATVENERCSESIEELGKAVDPAAQQRTLALSEEAQSRTLDGVLSRLHSLHSRRCLVP